MRDLRHLLMGDDPYPLELAFGGDTNVGSVGNRHLFKMNLQSGASLGTSVQNTAPPVYTQTVEYGNTEAAYGFGRWFGGPANLFSDELVANYVWAIVDLTLMVFYDGNFGVNEQQPFAYGDIKTMRLQYTGGGRGGYTLRIYRKSDFVIVANIRYSIQE